MILISLRSILIVSYHLRIGLPKGLFPVGISIKILKAFPHSGSHNIVRVIKSRRLRWTGHVEEDWSAFKISTGIPTEKRLSGRPTRRWEGNIRMDLREISINTGN